MGKNHNSSPFLKRFPGVKIGIIALILFFIVGVSSAFTIEKEIVVSFEGKETTVKGKLLDTLAVVLDTNHFPTGAEYKYSFDLLTLLKDVDKVDIQKKLVGNLLVDGKTIAYKLSGETVEELLEEYDIQLSGDDRVEPALDTKLTEKTKEVKVTRVRLIESANQKEMPFVSTQIENPELPEGTQRVVQPGQKGISNVKERIRFENGIEVSRELLAEDVVAMAVEEKLEIGIGRTETVVAEEVQSAKTTPQNASQPSGSSVALGGSTGGMTVSATAYTHTGNRTATGTWPQVGRTIAGWPGILGKTVYIPALGGTYVVEDTGGAVGHGVIDIFMDTEGECIQWGRRNIEIFILD
ncbi:MAG: G5 domain-containing protein [Eubacteriaceae bacterium]